MTTPTCKFCQKPASEHGMDGNTDVCVAKLKGWTDIKNIVMPAIGLVGLPPDGDEKEPVPHYSKDMNDAMTLWREGWAVYKRTNCGTYDKPIFPSTIIWSIWDKQILIDWCQSNFDNKYKPIIEADTLETAICRAYLIEAKEE